MNAAPLRIALFTHSVNPRGGVVHTLELGRALHDEGHDVTVFAPTVADAPLFRASPCRVVLANVALKAEDTVSMVQTRIEALKTAVRSSDPGRFDIFHAQDSISGNALSELRDEAVIRGFVRTVHHLDTFADARLAEWQRRAYANADAVFCVSDTWARTMADSFGIDAATVSNGVDTQRFCVASDDQSDAQLLVRFGIGSGPVVLAVGGIEARKNTLLLLEAFALFRQQHLNAQLVVAGGASLLDHDAYTRRFVARAAELALPIGAGQAVVVAGTLADEAVPALMRRADVVSMVSLSEGFGLVVLEALAAGTPVVVSQIAPFTEHLNEALCCWAQPHDAHSIADALERAQHARGGIDFERTVPALLQRFSWRASALRQLALYRQHLALASAEPII